MYLRLYSVHAHRVHTCMDTHKQTHRYSFMRKAPAALQLYVYEPQHYSELHTVVTPKHIASSELKLYMLHATH